jgi:hypothetical protein
MYFPVEMDPGNAFILSDQPPPSLSIVPLASELQAQNRIVAGQLLQDWIQFQLNKPGNQEPRRQTNYKQSKIR